eukprot:6185865-Pleurochrysis_carterae.AAC.4
MAQVECLLPKLLPKHAPYHGYEAGERVVLKLAALVHIMEVLERLGTNMTKLTQTMWTQARRSGTTTPRSATCCRWAPFLLSQPRGSTLTRLFMAAPLPNACPFALLLAIPCTCKLAVVLRVLDSRALRTFSMTLRAVRTPCTNVDSRISEDTSLRSICRMRLLQHDPDALPCYAAMSEAQQRAVRFTQARPAL